MATLRLSPQLHALLHRDCLPRRQGPTGRRVSNDHQAVKSRRYGN